MGILTVHRVCRAGNGPTPTHVALAEMFDQLTRALAELRAKPVRVLKSESWPIGSGQMLTRLRIECEEGDPGRRFASWWQWQHASWRWSLAILPTVDCTSVECAHGASPLLAPMPQQALPGAEL